MQDSLQTTGPEFKFLPPALKCCLELYLAPHIHGATLQVDGITHLASE